MIDERAYELLCCQLGLANEEKAGLRKQVNEVIARLKAIEESDKENSKALVDTINELSATVENYRKEMELMRKQLEAKDEVNMMPANEISNLRLQLEDSRNHRFGRTSEQRRLLNNHNIDKSAMEKSEYDGSDKKDDDNKANGNESGGNTSSDNATAQNSKPSRRKGTAPRTEKTRQKVDKVMVHEIKDYYQLPEGTRFMNRNGMIDVWEYRVVEHVRAHNVEHVYKVARNPIGDMFRNEDLFRTMKLSGEQIKEKRRKLTGPILERIHHMVVMMMQDTKLMANELMRKAATTR